MGSEVDVMNIDNALEQLANAPLDHVDISQLEASVLRSFAQTTTVIKSQVPIRFGVMSAALVVGVSLGGVTALTVAQNQNNNTPISGAHLAPSALLARAS